MSSSIRRREFASSSHTPREQQLTLSWSNVSAWINEVRPDSRTRVQRHLIKSSYGIAKPGQMMAIMGASGAGKTTLLNIISGRLSKSRSTVASATEAPVVEGSVQLNGRDVSHRIDILRRFAAFVEQDDVFPGFLTVEEHLWFHAKLRMTRPGTTDEERRSRINALLQELNMTKTATTKIGYPQMGMKTLSGGERKRLSVAMELISNPPLLLLDEPTSGLDSFNAESTISALRQLAEAGKTVAFTIHQPSSELFGYFDRLLLLSEGLVCYNGDAREAANFFASKPLNRKCPPSFNPTDFYLDVLSRPSMFNHQQLQTTGNVEDDPDVDSDVLAMRAHAAFINEAFNTSNHGAVLRSDLERIAKESSASDNIEDFVNNEVYINLVQPRASAWTQLQWSTWRATKSFYRSPHWMRIRIGQAVVFSLVYGLFFLGLTPSTPRGVMNINGLLNQLVSLSCWDNIDAYSTSLPLDRPYLLRDTSAGLYTLSAYFFGRQFMELPMLLALAAGQASFTALLSNIWSITTVTGAFQIILACFLTGLNASSFGYLIGFASENVGVQITIRRVILVLMSLLAGFYINILSVPTYLIWMLYGSFFYWANEAVFVAEWSNVESLECPSPNSPDFDPSFIHCFNSGREVLDSYGYGDASKLTMNFLILLAMVLFWRALALFVLYYRSYGSVWWGMIKAKFRRQ